MLQIYLFGAFSLQADYHPLPALPTQKAASLLAYLATHPRKDLPREYLAGLLWPDSPADKARRRLHTALWQVRQVFKQGGLSLEDYLSVSSSALRWQPAADAWLDVTQFEQACQGLEIGALEDAVRLYRGPFLENFYEDWCLEMRYQYEAACCQALLRLAELHLHAAHPVKCLECARRLLQVEPLNEGAHRLLMQAYYNCGQRPAALEQFRQCMRRLEEELGIQPSSDTRRLYESILAESLPIETAQAVLQAAAQPVTRPAPAPAPARAPAPPPALRTAVFGWSLFNLAGIPLLVLLDWISRAQRPADLSSGLLAASLSTLASLFCLRARHRPLEQAGLLWYGIASMTLLGGWLALDPNSAQHPLWQAAGAWLALSSLLLAALLWRARR